MVEPMEPYEVLLVQNNIKPVYRGPNSPPRRGAIKENLKRCLEIVHGQAGRGGPKLVAFPEFFIQGFGGGQRSIKEIIENVCVKVPGEETDMMAKTAQELDIYIEGCVLEVDDDWPGRYFDTSFIIDPNGKIILRYRKHWGGEVGYTIPNDILSEYIKKYGKNQLFPVVDTPLGKLACIICGDIAYPEITKIFVMRGAEVIIYSTLEPMWGYFPRETDECKRRTRAVDNLVYLLKINGGNILDSISPKNRSRGYSEIIGYDGRVLAVADTDGEAVISGEIDVEALRRRRSWFNPLFNCHSALYAMFYQDTPIWPPNRWAKKPLEEKKEYQEVRKEVVKSLYDRGILMKPARPHPKAASTPFD